MSGKSLLSTVGWGVYGASSWTWCIGMFLPLILLREYGWWGFIVFALPNVLGCAAFGYVVRTSEQSEAMLAAHRRAATAFSFVTIVYHAYFAAYLALLLTDNPLIALAAPVALILASLGGVAIPARMWPILAVLVWIISLVVGIWIGAGGLDHVAMNGARSTGELIPLVPVMAFGFLLCPYLDLTFHRALRESPSRHAFAVFGVTFLAMILVTCLYATRFRELMTGILLGHLVLQSVFTVAAHARELRQQAGIALPGGIGLLIICGMVGVIPVALGTAYPADENYLRFLVFYGLVFPTYVLLAMGGVTPSRPGKLLCAVIVLLILVAAPAYEIGFIQRRTWMLLPAIMLILIVYFARRVIIRPTE